MKIQKAPPLINQNATSFPLQNNCKHVLVLLCVCAYLYAQHLGPNCQTLLKRAQRPAIWFKWLADITIPRANIEIFGWVKSGNSIGPIFLSLFDRNTITPHINVNYGEDPDKLNSIWDEIKQLLRKRNKKQKKSFKT